jgi:hypothetical protein
VLLYCHYTATLHVGTTSDVPPSSLFFSLSLISLSFLFTRSYPSEPNLYQAEFTNLSIPVHIEVAHYIENCGPRLSIQFPSLQLSLILLRRAPQPPPLSAHAASRPAPSLQSPLPPIRLPPPSATTTPTWPPAAVGKP